MQQNYSLRGELNKEELVDVQTRFTMKSLGNIYTIIELLNI